MASSAPATSPKVTVGRLPRMTRARLRPNCIVWLLDPWAWRIMKSSSAPMNMSGRKLSRMPKRLPTPPPPLTVMGMAAVLTPALSRISTRLEPASLREVRLRASVVLMVSLSPSTSMLRISPLLAISTTSVMGMFWEPYPGWK